MQKYLQQLIDDMHKSAKNLPTKPYFEIPPEAEGVEYVVEWENAEPRPMVEWFGIPKNVFPPVDRLSKEQLKLMVDEILDLWQAYNFEAVLPENLPDEIAYKVLIDYWDKPVIWISEGISGIEFCNYNPENCPFPYEFCMCKDIIDDEEFNDTM